MAGFEGLGALVTGALGGYARRPNIPFFTSLDMGSVILGLLSRTEQQLPEITRVVDAINEVISSQNMRTAERFAPGFASAQRAQMEAATDLSRGFLPKAVRDAIGRESAGRNIESGTLASAAVPGGFSNFGHLFRTGQGVLSGIGFGSQLASEATSRARAFAPNLVSPTAFMFTPQQAADIEWRNKMAQFDVEMARNIRAATPDPARAAFAQGVGNDLNFWLGTAATMGLGAIGGIGGAAGAGAGAASGAGVGSTPAYAQPNFGQTFGYRLQ